MLSKTNFKISKVHLTSRLKQTAVAVLSVTSGIAIYIFMNSFMGGVNKSQTDLSFSSLAHIRIYNDVPEDKTNLLTHLINDTTRVNIRNSRVIQYTTGIKNSQGLIQSVKNVPNVIAVSPQLNQSVFFKNGQVELNGSLSGIEVEGENKLFNMEQFVVAGSWNTLKYITNGIVIGKGLAHKLSLKVNDNLNVVTSDGVSKLFKIVALLEMSNKAVDDSKGYININQARQLSSKNSGYVTDININISDYEAAEMAEEILSRLTAYKVESWNKSNGQLVAANTLRSIIAIAVSLTILIVAGFGIYNIMNMTVNEKIKEIAILKAMGFDGRDIVSIFLSESLIIGSIGGLIGLLFGYLISLLVGIVPFKMATFETLPIQYNLIDYVLALFFGIIVTFIAGYLPAKKASKVDPVEIIRG